MTDGEDRDFEFALFPILRSQSAVDYFHGMIGVDGDVDHWGNQTFHPRRDKYVVDIVGYLKDGTVLHIEQETAAKAEMRLRMLEYATLILVDCDFERKLRQILFYTGDRAKRWGHKDGPVPGTFEAEHPLGYLRFKYLVVDAGQPDPSRIAEAGFPAAALGLLARTKKVAREVSRILAVRIANMPPSDRQVALVACSNVLRVKGWRSTFEAELREVKVNEPIPGGTPHDFADGIQAELIRVARSTIAFKGRFDPSELDRLLPDELTYDQAHRIAVYASEYTSAAKLLDACGIEPRSSSRRLGMVGGSDD